MIARKPGEAPPPGYTLFQRNEYNASLVWEEKAPVSVEEMPMMGELYSMEKYISPEDTMPEMLLI